METATKFFTASILMLFIGLSADVNGQGRGNGHGHGHGKDKGHGHDKRGGHESRRHDHDNHRDRHDHHDRHDRHDHHDRHNHHDHHRRDRVVHHYPHHDHNRRVVHHVYHHQHNRHCGHRVVVHRYERPRYIYYRDYDVYYDCHRSVYISYSGRNWTLSASLPVVLHRVDIHHATRVEVDYYDDDFVTYLDRGRPMYGGVYVGVSW